MVPTILTEQESLPQGIRAFINQRRNLALRSGFITISSFSRSSQTIKSGRLPPHFKPRTFCSDPFAMILNLSPLLNWTIILVSVSFMTFFMPKLSLKASFPVNSALISPKNSAACPSVSETSRQKDLTRSTSWDIM